jgi:bacterioferritin-associated ferredoxin
VKSLGESVCVRGAARIVAREQRAVAHTQQLTQEALMGVDCGVFDRHTSHIVNDHLTNCYWLTARVRGES